MVNYLVIVYFTTPPIPHSCAYYGSFSKLFSPTTDQNVTEVCYELLASTSFVKMYKLSN